MNKSKKTKRTKEERAQQKQRGLERRLRNKLMRTVTKAGLSWTAWSGLIEISDTINGSPLPFDTACWVYNEQSKKEQFIFSTRIVKDLPVALLEKVMKHEMLHKSMYRGSPNVGNHELYNFALDAAINKILWMSSPKDMMKLGNWLVPEESDSRSGIHSILNPATTTKDFSKMSSGVKAIAEEVWWVPNVRTNKDGIPEDQGRSCSDWFNTVKKWGNANIPDPVNLYNKMAALLSREEKQQIEKEYECLKKSDKNHPRGGDKNLRSNDKNTIAIEKGLAEKILQELGEKSAKQNGRFRRSKGFSSFTDMKAFFEKFVYPVEKTETEGINDFMSRWQTLKQIEGICESIHQTFRKHPTIDPFPFDLTRTGIELMTLGISGQDMPFFFNNTNNGEGAKKKVCCYFDTSPSMNDYIPSMLSIASYIDDCEEAEIAGGKYNGHYGFSEKVKGIPNDQWEKFKNGEIQGGGGTSFEAVLTHACERIEQDQVDIIVVFTDGYSGVSDKTIEKFNESGRKCYTIYFNHGNFNYSHQRYGREQQEMTSDLDKTNGEGFTISIGNME